uniref:Uncharacterized protein n=1 Tax=Anguilla anguilla TaxID=7936 RepID=A0A0E9PLX4_ANGAN
MLNLKDTICPRSRCQPSK